MKKLNFISRSLGACASLILIISNLNAQLSDTGWTCEQQLTCHLDGLLKTWPVKGSTNSNSQPDQLGEWDIPQDIPLSAIYNDLAKLEVASDSSIERVYGTQEQTLAAATQGMQLKWNRRADHFVHLYLNDKKESTAALKGLSKHYFPLFERELQHAGLPTGLKYFPAAASGMNPLAVAQSGASGMWQLHYLPAKRYGLRVSEPVDERRHVRKSTTAALEHLKALHSKFHDWHLAIAAYHSGPANVNKALKKASNPKDFWSVYPHLPEETRDYVPAYLAVIVVLNGEAGAAIEAAPIALSGQTDLIPLERDITMEPVADLLDIPIAQIRALNPTYRSDIIPGGEAEYPFQLPRGYGLKFEANKDSLFFLLDSVINKPPPPKPKPKPKPAPKPIKEVPQPAGSVAVEYVIQSGDALYTISKWFGVSVEAIQSWNGLKNAGIRAEDKLKIYVPSGRKAYFEKMNTLNFEEKQQLIGK